MIVTRTYDGHFNVFGLTYRQLEDLWRVIDSPPWHLVEEFQPIQDALTRQGVEYCCRTEGHSGEHRSDHSKNARTW